MQFVCFKLHSRSEADKANGMQANYYGGLYASVTWLSYNQDKEPKNFEKQLDVFFSKCEGDSYKWTFPVSNALSSLVSNIHSKHISLCVQIEGNQKTMGCDKARIAGDEIGICPVLVYKNLH